jgi:heavy metal translocating P-type ATPase
MRPQVAHAVRGRLRVRYPVHWLRTQGKAVEERLRAIPGVRRVEGRRTTGSVWIYYDPFLVAEATLLDELGQLTKRLDDATRRPLARGSKVVTQRAPLVNLIGTTAVLALTRVALPGPILAGLVLAAGLPPLAEATRTLMQRRRVNGSVLEASTLALLAVRGHYTTAALLCWLRALGHYIVTKTVMTTQQSAREAIPPWDTTIVRVVDGARDPVLITSLRHGDIVLVEAPHLIPVDGVVVRGEALVDQQTMTGEALPVERRPGDAIFAATKVEHGRLEIRAERVGRDTVVGQIVEAIAAAVDEKSDIQMFAEELADREVGRTLGLAAIGTLLARSINAGVAILTADYGTAARVGIPTAVLTSMRRASREGILIKGPRALENLARVDTVVFDKTGTLTTATPRVTDVATFARSLTADQIVALAAAAERRLEHPIARAIARLATERRLDVPRVTPAAESVGLGVEVDADVGRVLVGSRQFMESRSIPMRPAAEREAAAHALGAAPTFVAADGRLIGMLVLQDQLRDDAPAAVRALRSRRMRNVILLSGDHALPSRLIAESLGLHHHYAELRPEQKAALVRQLKAEGRIVAMIGDGVNDALALEEADVGIAVPGGAALAAAAADVVLMKGGLERVVRALDLARAAMANVRRTLEISSRANLGVVGLASVGFAPPLLSVLLSHGAAVGAALWTAGRGSAGDDARA